MKYINKVLLLTLLFSAYSHASVFEIEKSPADNDKNDVIVDKSNDTDNVVEKNNSVYSEELEQQPKNIYSALKSDDKKSFSTFINSSKVLSSSGNDSIVFLASGSESSFYLKSIADKFPKDFKSLIEKKNANSRFSVHNAVLTPKSIDALTYLILSNVSTNVVDANQQTPLHYAAALNKPDHALILLKHKQDDLYTKDKFGLTPRDYIFRKFDLKGQIMIYPYLNKEDKFTVKDTVSKIGNSYKDYLIKLGD